MILDCYKSSWKFLKEIKKYFLIISLLFFGAALIGYLFPVFLVDFILDYIQQVIEQTQGMGFLELLGFILLNNISTAFFGVVLGVLIGIFPVFNAFLNGYVIGFVMNRIGAEIGFGGVLLRLIPHGIFEIPALIISLGLGLRLGMFILAKNKKKDLKYSFENALRVFLFVVVPLLIIAAIIETGLIFLLG
jgi:stage II sporulation protein M